MSAGTLVGPLPVIRFWDGTTVVYAPPANTLDVRYAACTDHHPACDCREAEWAEDRAERRALADEDRLREDALSAVGKLHRSVSTGQYGVRMCGECLKAWPCPTRRLAVPHAWVLRLLEERGEA